MKARLIASRGIAPNTRHFEFEGIDWDGAFTPGQFLSLTAWIDGEEITRAYSIASPPDGRNFALCANLVADGRFSPFLFGLRAGEEVDFKGPYGTFTLRPAATPVIMVATGTGIAPFRSMLAAAVIPPRHITLIFGVRHEEGLMYHEEFQALGIDYRPTLTRPPHSWTGRSGRVQAHALEALAEHPAADVYICGLREMVDELRAQLKAAGLDRKRIISEKYD